MWLDQILRPGAVIDPLDGAGLSINRVEESTHERPDAGAAIDRLVPQDRATTGGPGRNQTTVSDGVLCAGRSAETPLERSVRRPHAVQKSGVAAKVDPLITCHRWQAYWRFREDGPESLASVDVQGDDLVAVIEAQEHAVSQNNGFQEAVVGHQVAI